MRLPLLVALLTVGCAEVLSSQDQTLVGSDTKTKTYEVISIKPSQPEEHEAAPFEVTPVCPMGTHSVTSQRPGSTPLKFGVHTASSQSIK